MLRNKLYNAIKQKMVATSLRPNAPMLMNATRMEYALQKQDNALAMTVGQEQIVQHH